MTAQAIITLAGIVLTAFVTWSIAQRRIVVEHVTVERSKWRRKVRAKALEVHDVIVSGCDAQALRLQQKFRALLNPYDAADKEILNCIRAGGGKPCRNTRAEQFAVKISYLLKHDWDRAKLEAGFFLGRWTLRVNRCRGGIDDVAQTGLGQEWKDWRKKYAIRRWRILLVVAVAAFLAGGLTAGWLKVGTTGEKPSSGLVVVVVDRGCPRPPCADAGGAGGDGRRDRGVEAQAGLVHRIAAVFPPSSTVADLLGRDFGGRQFASAERLEQARLLGQVELDALLGMPAEQLAL